MYEWLNGQIDLSIKIAKNLGFEWRFSCSNPALELYIKEYESSFRVSLPKSYRNFLKICNGAHLFERQDFIGTFLQNSEMPQAVSDESVYVDSGLLIFGVKAPFIHREYLKNSFSDVYEDAEIIALNSIIPFCYPGDIGNSDFCALDTRQQTSSSEYAVIYCDHDYRPSHWGKEVIAPSFDVWLTNVFDRVVLEHRSPDAWFDYDEADSSLRITAAYEMHHKAMDERNLGNYSNAIDLLNQALELYSEDEFAEDLKAEINRLSQIDQNNSKPSLPQTTEKRHLTEQGFLDFGRETIFVFGDCDSNAQDP